MWLAFLATARTAAAEAEDAASTPTGQDPGSSAIVSGPDGLTLGAAVAGALADGHAARIAQLETGRSGDAAGQERSAYLPHASVTSNAGYNTRQNEKLVAVDRRGRVSEYGLSSLGSDEGWFNVYLDQLLLDLATWQRIERAELEAEATGLLEAQEREVVVYDVVQRFTEAVRQARYAELARERLASTEALDQQAALLLEAGRARPADREQVALLLEEARIERFTREGDADSARAALAVAMGREGVAAPETLDAKTLPDTEAMVEGEPEIASSPELKVLDLRRRAEEKGVAIARAGHLPTVAVRGGYSHYGVKRFDNYPDAAQVGVNVDIPLFQGFKNEYAVEGAAKSAEIARIRYRSVLESKRARVRELQQRLLAGRETPELAARRAAVSQERLRLADLNLRADRGSLDEALGALSAHVRDAGAAVDGKLDRVLVWAQLQREAGTLARSFGVAPPSPN